jgi:two-component system sensor histidine kinase CreC
VKIRSRLILTFVSLVMLGFLGLIVWIINDLWPRYMATMEESMVDTATLFSTLLEGNLKDGKITVDPLRLLFQRAEEKRLEAHIYEETKENLELRVYVTDNRGIVLFDSDGGKAEGMNYLRLNDVLRTLRGEYGARTSSRIPGDPTTAVLYVAAPIKYQGRIAGVVTVCKEARSATRFLAWGKRRIIAAGLFAALAVALLGAGLYSWLSRPIEKLMQYAIAVRDGRRVRLPELGGNEIGRLGEAFEQMRVALDGKEYISRYVQALTHEMKSPLSAIRGAAELLEEEMPAAQRARFIGNIRGEALRLQELIDRLLQLAALEQRHGLLEIERIELEPLLAELTAAAQPLATAKGLRIHLDCPPGLNLHGERFLIRQAVQNVLQNALEFSPEGGAIEIAARQSGSHVEVEIRDAGPGIPDYARGRIFEKFYSLPRPDTGKKSSGLGLTITREALALHGGTIGLEAIGDSAHPSGTRATLRLPAERLSSS